MEFVAHCVWGHTYHCEHVAHVLVFQNYFQSAGAYSFDCLIWYDVNDKVAVCHVENIRFGWGTWVCPKPACTQPIHVQMCMCKMMIKQGKMGAFLSFCHFHITATISICPQEVRHTPKQSRWSFSSVPSSPKMIAGNYWFAVSAWDQSSLTGMTLLWKLLLGRVDRASGFKP